MAKMIIRNTENIFFKRIRQLQRIAGEEVKEFFGKCPDDPEFF